ncbi:MAG: ribosome silencing factor [Alphaproteobacteria bacterium]
MTVRFTAASMGLRDAILGSLEMDKAIDSVVIELPADAIWADGLIIASGTSDRHLRAMAEKLGPVLKGHGIVGVRIEGSSGSGWLLLDGGLWIVHLFKPELRALYDLEGLWGFGREGED